MLKRMIVAIALCFLSAPAWAQKLESCHCYCGKNIPAPCGDEDCKAACGWQDNVVEDTMEEMPTVLPFHVKSYIAGKEALERGDYDAALRELNAATASNTCFAPAYEQLGELFLRVVGRWNCTWENEPTPCDEVAAYELWHAATGCSGGMQGMAPEELAQLKARAEPLFDIAYAKRHRRLATRVMKEADVRMNAGDVTGAEQDYRYVVGLFNGAVRPTKDDLGHCAAYDGLAAALEAQGDVYGAIDALEGAQKAPCGTFYRATPLGNLRQEKIDRLKRRAGYCQVVLDNDTYDTLDLYINDSDVSVCRALGRPAPPSDGSPVATPPYPTFCTAHVREGTYTLSAKTPDGTFFTKASGPVWCPKGEVRHWNVTPK